MTNDTGGVAACSLNLDTEHVSGQWCDNDLQWGLK